MVYILKRYAYVDIFRIFNILWSRSSWFYYINKFIWFLIGGGGLNWRCFCIKVFSWEEYVVGRHIKIVSFISASICTEIVCELSQYQQNISQRFTVHKWILDPIKHDLNTNLSRLLWDDKFTNSRWHVVLPLLYFAYSLYGSKRKKNIPCTPCD